MIVFPKSKAAIENRNIMRIIYSPAVLVCLYVLFVRILEPERTNAFNTINTILFTVYVVGNLVSAAIAMVCIVQFKYALF